MPDGTADDKKPQDGGSQDVEYWRNEAKAAFIKRDELKKQMARFEGVDPDEHRRLKDQLAEIEQDRLKASGQFEAAKKAIEERSKAALDAATTKATALEQQIAADKIETAFLSASALFGPGGETVLDADVATAYFRPNVKFETVEIAGKEIRTVVVYDATGNIVRGPDGNPAPFTDAMRQVIKALPQDKQDRLLRGSGKTGSGSSGGSTLHAGDDDLDAVSDRARRGDKEAAKILHDRQARMGGVVQGSAWNRQP